MGETNETKSLLIEKKAVLHRSPSSIVKDTDPEYVIYKERWLYLLLFVLYSASNSFNWVQLTIIADTVEKYYDVSTLAVTWTAMLYYLPYILLIFPATWYLQNKGLRPSLIVGALGNCLGCWIKVFGTKQSGFPIVFVGQAVTAMSEVFILGIPSELAATWFPRTQVSLACAIGVFGNQMGVALGFLIPPIVVGNKNESLDPTLVGSDLFNMFISIAIFTTILLILILSIFPNLPPSIPSKAEEIAVMSRQPSFDEIREESDYVPSIRRLLNNPGFIILLLAYGILVGTYYSISSLLDTVLLLHFDNAEADSGRIGFVIVVCGMVGSVLCGSILDLTHAYKGLTITICGFSFLGMAFYTIAMYLGNLKVIYISAGVLGFFMTGYLPVGFEFGVEMTYPESEGTSSGLLNASAKFFAIFFTFGYEQIISTTKDDTFVNILMASALLICTVLTVFIRFNQLRQKANSSYSINLDSQIN